MALEAPAILVALEQSALGTAIRQSVWIYPAANTVHILGLTLLAASVAVMDLRLLGAFKETVPAAVIVPARRLAMLARPSWSCGPCAVYGRGDPCRHELGLQIKMA